jgi:peptidoglycan hydrolase-like protein with peptidoglycan-binding domain
MYRTFTAAAILFLATPLLASAQAATPTDHSVKAPATVPAKAQQPANQQPAKTSAKKETAPTEAQIREAQQDLAKAGLYKGQVTGKSNTEFQNALKKFQTSHKLKATGHLDMTTLEALRKM